jgi:hypothetical protein
MAVAGGHLDDVGVADLGGNSEDRFQNPRQVEVGFGTPDEEVTLFRQGHGEGNPGADLLDPFPGQLGGEI